MCFFFFFLMRTRRRRRRKRRTLINQDLQDEGCEVQSLSFVITVGTHGPPQKVNRAKQSGTNEQNHKNMQNACFEHKQTVEHLQGGKIKCAKAYGTQRQRVCIISCRFDNFLVKLNFF